MVLCPPPHRKGGPHKEGLFDFSYRCPAICVLLDGGLTRQEVSALGTHTVYWLWFDEPQFDADGDGPYSGGQVWESALRLLTEGPN